MRLFSTVVEQMVLQNSISTNDFSHSVQGWSFSPVCISKCLPKVLELLNDFLHSVVQLCGFSSLSMNMCSFSFPVCVNDLLHCAQGFCHWRKRRKWRGEDLVIGTNCKTLSSAIGSLLRIICTKCFSRCSIIMMIIKEADKSQWRHQLLGRKESKMWMRDTRTNYQ